MHCSFARFAFAVGLASAFAVSACTSPGEGDRCDTNDDNGGDCASGLQCRKAVNYDVFVCCPPQGAATSASICGGASGGGGGADASIPADDAGDAATDAPVTDGTTRGDGAPTPTSDGGADGAGGG